MSVAGLRELKRAGKKIVAVVAWDYPMAQIADRAGVDLVSVGDSVGVNLWGQKEGEITVDELLVVARAVRRGVKRALVSFDLPENASPAEAKRLMQAGADMVKILASPDVIREVAKNGVPVFAEMHAERFSPEELVAKAQQLQAAGAAMIDFRHSGPVAGAAVAKAVAIPVIGGLGGGPWLDGRVRRIDTLIGYPPAQPALDALNAYAQDVRDGKTLKSDRA
ncbi:MAG TPA: 3-methyl-2-oxobutanoate hydroxymethyltransferase [Burkholderiales bacterium]|nr:3-methyl-2-oxobutanoate hydroxymethyltransferase [Burkholderiales bacterium]